LLLLLLLQDLGFNASNMEVKVLINEQVPEIAQVSRHTVGVMNADGISLALIVQQYSSTVQQYNC
jgi:hypothetical protein